MITPLQQYSDCSNYIVHVSALSLLCCDYYDMLAVTTATILTIVTTVSM